MKQTYNNPNAYKEQREEMLKEILYATTISNDLNIMLEQPERTTKQNKANYYVSKLISGRIFWLRGQLEQLDRQEELEENMVNRKDLM